MQPSLFDIVEEPPRQERPQPLITHDCVIPGYWPTCNGDPQKSWDQIKALQRKDVSALRLMRAKWWCNFCGHWHDFDAFFFQTFDGVYPFEITRHDDLWHQRFGGWEARLRREFNLVGKSSVDVFRELTHAVVYAYWANGGDIGRECCGDGEEDPGAGEATRPGNQGSSGESRDSASRDAGTC